MFNKLLLVVAALGAIAVALLVNRQQRIETAHETAVLHERLAVQEQDLWRLRSEIAEACRPGTVQQAMTDLSATWSPIELPPPPRRLTPPPDDT